MQYEITPKVVTLKKQTCELCVIYPLTFAFQLSQHKTRNGDIGGVRLQVPKRMKVYRGPTTRSEKPKTKPRRYGKATAPEYIYI